LAQGEKPSCARKPHEAVEKRASERFAEIGSRWEALQAIFSALLDIFYLRILRSLQKTEFFNSFNMVSTQEIHLSGGWFCAEMELKSDIPI
jgi:hypothetical protein